MKLRVKSCELIQFYKGWSMQCQADFGSGLTQDIDYLWSINYETGFVSLRFDSLLNLEFWLVLNEDRKKIHCPKSEKGKRGSPFFIEHLGQHIFTIKNKKNPKFYLDIVFFENF